MRRYAGGLSSTANVALPLANCLQVDGVDMAFAYFAAGATWAAVRATGADEIRVLGHGLPPDQVPLVSVVDLVAYVDSELRQIERSRPARRKQRHV